MSAPRATLCYVAALAIWSLDQFSLAARANPSSGSVLAPAIWALWKIVFSRDRVRLAENQT